MRDLVTALRELQELEIIAEESRIVHRENVDEHMGDVMKRIQTLRDSLPTRHLRRFDGLKRTGVPVVREIDTVCTGCHLSVSRGDLNRMLRGDKDWLCPHCGRFLLLAE